MLKSFFLFLICLSFFAGCNNEAPVSSDFTESADLTKGGAETAEVIAFQPAGDFGGGVLVPGTFFPPTSPSFSKLSRGDDWIKYDLKTNGLPPGAYTNWYVIINNPEECEGSPCNEADVFGNPATNTSIFWSTGGIVKNNGKGKFKKKVKIGEISEDPRQHIFGPGLLNPKTAEVHIIVKYHGLASDDPDELWLQTNTLTGLCEEGANAYDLGPPFGVQCFDPQIAIHRPESVEVMAFQPAGDFGGGVLVPGTFFPPTNPSFSKLRRGDDWIKYDLKTTGLPPGAYTNWYVIINNPEECEGSPCNEADIFGNPLTNSSVFWSTGGIVKNNGKGKFKKKVKIGEISEDPRQHIFGPGLLNPETAEVHIIVKYHGLASDDPDELWLQTHTLTGLCEEGANAYDLGPPFGVQCFDPQVAIHRR